MIANELSTTNRPSEAANRLEIRNFRDVFATLTIGASSPLNATDGFDRNNRILVFLIALSAPLFGSLASVLIWICLIWAVISIALGRFERRWTRDELLMGLCFAGFALVHLVASLFASGIDGYEQIVPLAVFLVPLALAPRLALSDRSIVFELFIIGSAVGVIGGACVAMAETTLHAGRASGFLGNPGILALIGTVAAGIGGINLRAQSGARRLLGFASLMAIFPIAITAQMRALWPAALLILVLLFITSMPKQLSKRQWLIAAGLGVAGMGTIAAFGAPMVADRLAATQTNIERILENRDFDNSIGQRLLMWDSAIEAIGQRPWTGYGLHERMNVVRIISQRDHPSIQLYYSHAHNAGLTALLDAGIAGLIALLVVWLAPLALALKRRNGAVALYFSILTIAYGSSGLTGIMYHHDLTDAFYVFAVIVGISRLGQPNTAQPPTD